MAPTATRAPGALLPRFPSRSRSSSFLVPYPSATATATATSWLARRGGGNGATVRLGVAPRSGRRDGWGADPSSSGGGGLVDEDMATLRRRIREARAAAAAAEDGIDSDSDTDALPLPAGWTELERRHHRSYVAGVRSAAGLLEALLVSARPGVGAGVLALLLLSVPASLLLVCTQLIQAVDSLSSAGFNGR
ncbi:hypothetical protein ACP70R_039610 [Stipagrostis hirtigluma subsp. patula]